MLLHLSTWLGCATPSWLVKVTANRVYTEDRWMAEEPPWALLSCYTECGTEKKEGKEKFWKHTHSLCFLVPLMWVPLSRYNCALPLHLICAETYETWGKPNNSSPGVWWGVFVTVMKKNASHTVMYRGGVVVVVVKDCNQDVSATVISPQGW